ncbi:Dihydroorotate dehydrogenase (quinone), mitochondrial [Pseudocyphellaria aurata]|nr:Dihydroorotate dehydrogenase (quinone), mitochondrial [Pseudocyphellaria aurata]
MVFNRPPKTRAVPLLSSLAAVQRYARHPQPSLSAIRCSPAINPFSDKPRTNARFASTSQPVLADARSLWTRSKNLLLGTSIGLLVAFGYYYITDTRASVHQWLAVPSLRWIYEDAEEAHEAGTKALKTLYELGLHPRERGNIDSAGNLAVEVFGHRLANPIGISAGLDKGAEIPTPLFSLGPAVVEVGGVTPHPQAGNAKPRVFRLPSQKALINRYGLNSDGADVIAMRLRQRVREYAYAMGFGTDEFAEQRVLDGEAGVPPGSLIEGKLLAVQIAKNTTTPDDDIEAVQADYVYCVEALAKYADILVVNISCPNTGSRQKVEPLRNILTSVVEAAKKVNRKTKPVVMVKVSPDEDSDAQVSSICDAIWESNVDGVIVSNTTKRRADLVSGEHRLSIQETAVMAEPGGYSGPQLFDRTVALVKSYRRILDDGMTSRPEPVSMPTQEPSTSDGSSSNQVADQIEATIQRDQGHFKDAAEKADKEPNSQPLVRLPASNDPFSAETSDPETPLSPASPHPRQQPQTLPDALSQSSLLPSSSPAAPAASSYILQAEAPKRKVIFASGGISNERQVQEVLAAGSSIALVYTALVYGGVGTVSSIKGGLDEMKRPGRDGGVERTE